MPTHEVATVVEPQPGQFTEAQRETHIAAILHWVSQGNTVRAYCRQPNTPHFTTVYDWLNSSEDYALRFARAREVGEQAISEECLQIADTPCEGAKVVYGPDGTTETREDMLGHRKLQIETRLKLLAKWNPKKWGEKVEHGGSVGLTLEQLLAKANE